MKEKLLNFAKSQGFWVVFALIFLVGILFRLLLIKLPLWYDEGCSWLIASKSFPAGINSYLLNADFQHTPLYFYYLHFWMKFFGESDISLRLSSLIPSAFIIPLVYVVTKQISSRKTALTAMFLTAFSVFQIYFASEVRMYPFVILFTLLSINAMLRYISDFKTSQLVQLIFINTTFAYLMIGSPIFVIAQFLCLISYLSQKNLKSEIKKVLLFNMGYLLLLIPYFMIIFHYFAVRRDFLVVHNVDFSLMNIIGVFQKFLSQYIENALYWVTTEPYTIGTKEFVMFIIPLCVMCFAVYRAVIRKEEREKLIVSISAITILAFIVIAQFKVIVFSPRYLVYVSPLLLILAAIGITTFDKKKAGAFLTFYFFAGILYLGVETGVVEYKNYSLMKPAQYVREHNLRKSDLVIMPFGSSVVGRYLGENSPRALNFEAIQEFRRIENNNLYTQEQQQLLKMLDKSKMFSEIIMPDTNISTNFEEYIRSNISEIPKGGTVLLIITGSDRLAFMNNIEYKNYFDNLQTTDNNLMFSFMTEFFRSLNNILSENFDIESSESDYLQMYITYRKIK